MRSMEKLKKHLRTGQVYRRADLVKWSKSIDRHLAQLMDDGVLVKLRQGLYLCPRFSRFGQVASDPAKLCRAFLKDDDFLLTTPNDYNALGLGMTQLYNCYTVYNHKRHGRFELEGQLFNFHMKHRFPKKLTPEFLLVDLVDNLNQIAEEREKVLERVKSKLPELDPQRLQSVIKRFAKVSTQKILRGNLCSFL